MNHDPLCPTVECPDCDERDSEWCVRCGGCRCDLIAKVKEQERLHIADAVFDNMVSHPYEYPSDYAEADRKWIKAGCPTDAIDALRGEPSWDFKMRSKLLGPHLEHHPNDPEQSRIWRNGEWVKP